MDVEGSCDDYGHSNLGTNYDDDHDVHDHDVDGDHSDDDNIDNDDVSSLWYGTRLPLRQRGARLGID